MKVPSFLPPAVFPAFQGHTTKTGLAAAALTLKSYKVRFICGHRSARNSYGEVMTRSHEQSTLTCGASTVSLHALGFRDTLVLFVRDWLESGSRTCSVEIRRRRRKEISPETDANIVCVCARSLGSCSDDVERGFNVLQVPTFVKLNGFLSASSSLSGTR